MKGGTVTMQDKTLGEKQVLLDDLIGEVFKSDPIHIALYSYSGSPDCFIIDSNIKSICNKSGEPPVEYQEIDTYRTKLETDAKKVIITEASGNIVFKLINSNR